MTHAYPTEFAQQSTVDFTVGSGLEVASFTAPSLGPISIDFTDSQIVITALSDFVAAGTPHNPLNGFNGLYFTVLGPGPVITDASVGNSSTAPWFSQPENLTFNTANVYVNFMDLLPGPVGQPMAQRQTLVIRVDTPWLRPVPEPSSAVLAGTALLLLGARKRRRPGSPLGAPFMQ